MLKTIAAILLVCAAPALAQTADQCSGHDFLNPPRPEGSCLAIKPQVYPSPDQALRAIVFPVGMDLHATPDIESRVVIRGNEARLITSKDYSSPRGANGHCVVRAKWSPDSQFFVYSMSSSGGHSPWQFPTWVFSREKERIVSFSDLIGGNPTVSDDFSFTGPHTIKAITWEKAGSDKQNSGRRRSRRRHRQIARAEVALARARCTTRRRARERYAAAWSPAIARSIASTKHWISTNFARARSALSRSNGAARTLACASRSSTMRSLAFFKLSSRSLMNGSLRCFRARLRRESPPDLTAWQALIM